MAFDWRYTFAPGSGGWHCNAPKAIPCRLYIIYYMTMLVMWIRVERIKVVLMIYKLALDNFT